MRAPLPLFLLSACLAAPPDANLEPKRNALIGLTVFPPVCLVAFAGEDVPFSYAASAAGRLTLEIHSVAGVSVVARRDVAAGESGDLAVPSASLAVGRNVAVFWMTGPRTRSDEQRFPMDVRMPRDGDAVDGDGDCYSPRHGDCDDVRSSINPGALEVCHDLIDNDCDGQVDCSGVCPDRDGDGQTSASCGGEDCDDTDANVFAGAAEVCNGRDDDCDGAFDENFDVDADNFAACGASIRRVDGTPCPPGFAYCADCDDSNDATFPGEGCLP